MMPIPNRDAVALSARTTGALFSYAPNGAENAPLVAAFEDGSWQQQWPFPVAARWRQGLPHRLKKRCRKAAPVYRAMGPAGAPGALSGWIKSLCCLAIPRWLCASGCARTVSRWRPMATNRKIISAPCYSAAWLCETEQDALFAQLLARHLLPWSGRFLSVFVDHAAHPFYQALGQLAQATLAQWQENLPIAVAQKPLYR